MHTDNLSTLMKMNGWKKVEDNFPSSKPTYYLNGFFSLSPKLLYGCGRANVIKEHNIKTEWFN